MNRSILSPWLSCLLFLTSVLAGCASDRSVGMNQLGLPVYLSEPGAGGAPIEDEARADAVIEAASERLSAELPSMLEEVVREVAVEAQFQPERIDLRWDGGAIDTDVVLLGEVTTYSGIDVEERTAAGLDFEGSVSAQVCPWPRRDGVLPHPELLMVQASVAYRADDEAYQLGELLAERLTERAREVVLEAAASVGLRGAKVKVTRPGE